MLAIYRKVFQPEMQMQRRSNQTKIFGVLNDLRPSIKKPSLGLTVSWARFSLQIKKQFSPHPLHPVPYHPVHTMH